MEEPAKHRLGMVRITNLLWLGNQEAITKCIGATHVENVLQSITNGSYQASVDFICIHPEFEEIVVEDGPIPMYACGLFKEQDGSFKRSEMQRVDPRTK